MSDEIDDADVNRKILGKLSNLHEIRHHMPRAWSREHPAWLLAVFTDLPSFLITINTKYPSVHNVWMRRCGAEEYQDPDMGYTAFLLAALCSYAGALFCPPAEDLGALLQHYL